MELTIGILSFNTKELLERCISSIYKNTSELEFEVIVVDNGSGDGSPQLISGKFPKVKLIRNKKNRFFSGGYNQIIKIARGKYFIMLNSDTYLEDNAFKGLLGFMEKRRLSVCEGLEVRPDGKPISTGSLFRTIRSDFYELSLLGRLISNKQYLKRIRIKGKSRLENFKVDVGCNAYFCIETDLLRKIGAYDEQFKLYYTEDDLSKRVSMKGYEIYHYGKSYIIHEEAKSTNQLGWKRIEIFYEDLKTYHNKYGNKYISLALYSLLCLELNALKLREFVKLKHFI